MAKTLRNTVSDFLRSILTENIAEALLAPQEIPEGTNVVQSLIKKPEKASNLNLFAPVLPVNSAKIVSNLTTEDSGKPIAVVLRPCEIRALIELVKLKQANIENLVIIGVDCFGTYTVSDFVKKAKELGGADAAAKDFLEKATSGAEIPELREPCNLCEFPIYDNVDISIKLFGVPAEKGIIIQSESDKGKQIFETLKMEYTPVGEGRKQAVEKLLKKRKETKKPDEIDFINMISSLCINCQNCRSVCPICYCQECLFKGQTFKYSGEKYLSWVSKKGIIKMPPDTLLFHLTRMAHVATSCVACGQCEAACPSKIPLGKIYHQLSSSVQKILGYQAGRSVSEELPLTAFREEELKKIER